MTAQEKIQAEFARRTKLVYDQEFRQHCADYAKKIGITPKEWNENKAGIIMFIANEVCAHENKLMFNKA